MSRYSQGVLARKLVNSPCRPWRLAAVGHDAVGDRLQRLEPGVAAVLDHDLEAAGRAQSFQRRAPKTLISPSWISFCKTVLQPGGDGVARQFVCRPLRGNRRA